MKYITIFLLAIATTGCSEQIKNDKKVQYEVMSSLQDSLKLIEDSIKDNINNQPIKLLDKIDDKKNNKELIALFKMSLSDVQHDGCDKFNEFSILGTQNFISGLDTFSCIVLGAICEEDMHPSSGTNFIGLFKISTNRQTKLLNIIEAKGSFGFGSCANLEGFKIMGRKNLCVILNSGYYGFGCTTENRSLYLINKSTIKGILEIEKHDDDKGNEGTSMYENIDKDWEIKFLDNKSDYFNLEIIEKSHGKKVKTSILKFNEKSMKYE